MYPSHAAERDAKLSLSRGRRVEIANVSFVDQFQQRVNSSTRRNVFERYHALLRYADVERRIPKRRPSDRDAIGRRTRYGAALGTMWIADRMAHNAIRRRIANPGGDSCHCDEIVVGIVMRRLGPRICETS